MKLKKRNFLKLALGAFSTHLINFPAYSSPNTSGTIRLGLEGSYKNDNFDSRKHFSPFQLSMGSGSLYETLTEIKPNGILNGELAKNWEVVSDAKEWIFNLRKNVKFHNNKTFNADDVIDTFEFHNHENSSTKVILSSIKEIKKISSHQIKFILHSANSDFPNLMSDPRLIIMPSKKIEDSIKNGIGTGPYKLKLFRPGSIMLAERFLAHHSNTNIGFISVELKAINNPTERFNLLRENDVDVINSVPRILEILLSNDKNFEVLHSTSNAYICFPMNVNKKPFNDPNVRLAIKHSCNRHEIVKAVFLGQGTIGNDHPLKPSHLMYNNGIEAIDYNPKKAKHLLKQSGIEKLNITLHTSEAAFPGAIDAANIFKTYAKPANINILISIENKETYFSDAKLKFNWYTSFSGGFPTADWAFSANYTKNQELNNHHWGNSSFEELLVLARKETNLERRRKIYSEIQQLFSLKGNQVIPSFYNFVIAYSKHLSHESQIGNNFPLDDCRIPKRWWFE